MVVGGSGSFTVTLVAEFGPAFVTVSVYASWPPTTIGVVGNTLLVIARSAKLLVGSVRTKLPVVAPPSVTTRAAPPFAKPLASVASSAPLPLVSTKARP